MKLTLMIMTLLFSSLLAFKAQADCPPEGFTSTPTDVTKTFIRKGNGQFGSARQSGSHKGTDIITRQSFKDASSYAVSSVANGTIAYARMNGTINEGYGNIVIIDHGNDCYSAYAHLASDPFTPFKNGGNLEVSIGETVNTNQFIGYFMNIKGDVDSTGNARKTAVEARHQIHFELINAPSGRSGNGKISDLFGNSRINPEQFLTSKGLNVE